MLADNLFILFCSLHTKKLATNFVILEFTQDLLHNLHSVQAPYISPSVGYWDRVENQEISLIKTIEHLSKASDYLFNYLCCKTEHKTQLSFRPKTKDFEVLME